jgi:dienelactone hydrolase
LIKLAVKLEKRRTRKWVVFALLALIALGLTAYFTRHHQRATALLLRIESKHPPSIATWNVCTVDEEIATLPHGLPGRLYRPREVKGAPGLVVLHGVHHLGIEEPRLRSFARTFAESCVLVLTPQLATLADYRIEPKAVEEIGAATLWLSGQLDRPAGVLGLSFAGGLALIAATDARYSQSIGYVVAVGSHSNLARVSRFLVTGQSELPDGRVQALQPQQYGALVLAFAHPDGFFPKREVPKAKTCMRLWLSEEYQRARACGAELSPGSNVMMEALFQYQIKQLREPLLGEIERQKDAMARVSPSGRLHAIKVPVFLLHGENDDVIPTSETMWLAREVPPKYLRKALISPAVGHVDPAQTSFGDKWALVSFLASVLREAERSSK